MIYILYFSVLIAQVGWDGKPSGEVGSRPLTAMDGAGTGGGGGERRLEVGMVHGKKNFFNIDSAKLRLWI